MKKSHMSLLLLVLILGQGFCSGQEPTKEIDYTNTYVIVVCLLEWESDSFSSFSDENRQDDVLFELFKSKGVPEQNLVHLKGSAATEKTILRSIEELAKKAKPESTFIFYYAGHGYTGPKGIYFASYDAGIKDKSPNGLWVNDVSRILNERFKGDQVLLFADCCYSGGLGEAAQELNANQINAASLTSASNCNTSTGNWTFTCNLIDALQGRNLFDHNSDGVITLSETNQTVRDAIHFCERQHHGFSLHGLDEDFVIAKSQLPEESTSIPEPYKLGQFVGIKSASRRRNRQRPARITGWDGEKLIAEIQRYHDRKIVKVAIDDIEEISRPSLPASQQAELPTMLPENEALEKATVNGKYQNLLKKIEAKYDYLNYSEFRDWGYYEQTSYMGYQDLPAGYWVYVFPHWYIFEKETTDKTTISNR